MFKTVSFLFITWIILPVWIILCMAPSARSIDLTQMDQEGIVLPNSNSILAFPCSFPTCHGFAKGVPDNGEARPIKITHPSVQFISARPSAFCCEVNRRAAVVRCSCWPLTDCSGNWVLWGQVRGGGGGGRHISAIYFDTDAQARAELRVRQACRLINILQLQIRHSEGATAQVDQQIQIHPHWHSSWSITSFYICYLLLLDLTHNTVSACVSVCMRVFCQIRQDSFFSRRTS